MRNPNALTLRRLEQGEASNDGDKLLRCQGCSDFDWYREVSPIPEGFEVCDIEDATKVLIGNTFLDLAFPHIQFGACTLHYTHVRHLGVLAIRPIPEPEPMKGEVTVGRATEMGKSSGVAVLLLPERLIGKRIRWEELP